jgi:autotransporter family porin
MSAAGTYLDTVAQVSALNNRYKDGYGGNGIQHGVRLGLSAEAGTPIAKIGNFTLEPQAQLMWLHTRYDNFSDQVSAIDAYGSDQVRGRLGARIYSGDTLGWQGSTRFYGIANVIHDFTRPETVTIGATPVSENYGRTFAEIGVGGQYKITSNGALYADARYQHSVSGASADGYQLNLGAKFEF